MENQSEPVLLPDLPSERKVSRYQAWLPFLVIGALATAVPYQNHQLEQERERGDKLYRENIELMKADLKDKNEQLQSLQNNHNQANELLRYFVEERTGHVLPSRNNHEDSTGAYPR